MTGHRRLAAGLALASIACAPALSANAATQTIGYSVSTLANPFFQAMSDGVKNGVAKDHDLGLINTSADGDANTQASQVQDMINQHVVALVLNPISADAIVPVVKHANKLGIPVFTIDRGAACGDCQVNFIETDNVAMGRENVDFIADRLKQRYGSIKGNVVDLEGLLGTTAGDARERGFNEEFTKLQAANPGLKLVARQAADFDAGKAFNIMTQLLAANPTIDAVFNANDDNAVGAMRAIKQANRFAPIGDPKHIVIISIDGTEQAVAAIRNGQMDGTNSQNPLTMSAQSVAYVQQYLHGDRAAIPRHQFWPHFLLTKETLASPEAKAYGIWADQVAH